MLTIRGVLAGDEQHVAEASAGQLVGLGAHLVRRQGASRDLVAGREAAVGAHRHALVRQVQRREQLHRAPEALEGDPVGGLREFLEPR